MKKLLLIILLISFNFVASQNFKFGKVSQEELQSTAHHSDEDVEAAVLYSSKEISFNYVEDEGFVRTTEVLERIKIYNSDGFKYGTRIEKLYNEDSQTEEKLLGLKAYTYNLEGGKIVESKLKGNGIFEEESNKYWKQFKMTMPNLNEGCIVEFKYRIESPLYRIDDIEFQYNIPINKLDYKLHIPDYFAFNKVLNPQATYVPAINESTRGRKLLVAYHPDITNSTSRAKAKFSKENLVERTYNITEKVYEASLVNIPGLKEEPHVDNLDNYRAIIKWELVAIKTFDDITKNYSKTWDQVTKTIYNRESFGGQLVKNNYFEADLDAVLKGVTDPLGKIATIYNFVKSKVKWNGYIGYGSNNGVKKAYKAGEGNTGDINLMLTAMLNYANFKASPILLSTRDNGIPLVPTTSGFNYVITAVEIPQGMILLDATSKYATANLLPTRAINWRGRIARDRTNSDWVNLKPNMISKDVISLNIKINDDLSIVGKVRNQRTNYLAMCHRNEFNGLSNDSHRMKLESDKGDIEISNIETKNELDLGKPIMMSYDYIYNEGIEEIGDQLYFSPFLFLETEENPFKQDTRNYPIDLVHPISETYKINIMLPDGYTVDTLPENSKIEFNGTEGDFSYLVRENGKMLQLTITFNLNKSIILQRDYDQFKLFYQLMLEKKAEKIVLKKV